MDTMSNLYKSEKLKRYRLIAADGEIGSINDFYFEQPGWDVRYLVVDAGNWLNRREVLISPIAIGRINEQEKTIDIELTKQQLQKSPSIDRHKPISRRYEEQYYRHFNWTPYWSAIEMDPISIPAPTESFGQQDMEHMDDSAAAREKYLRSESEVTGYHIAALDERIGIVKELIVDCYYWIVRYLVIDTRKWLPSKKVLLSPAWVTEINWSDQTVCVDLAREAIASAPEYDEAQPISREYEATLFKHYGMQVYWDERKKMNQ